MRRPGPPPRIAPRPIRRGLAQFVYDDHGATVVEYAIIASAMLVVVYAAGDTAGETLATVTSAVSAALAAGGP